MKICATSYGPANTCLPTVARVLAGLFAATLFAQSAFAATVVRVVNTTIGANQSGTVIIEMVATGEEAALGFTLNFDPARLTFVNAVLGQSVTSATLNVNNLQASSGRVGIVVGVSPGQAFTAGTLQLINFSFTSSSVSGSTQITFGDVPVVREISNRQAQALAATFTPGTVLINSPPVANGQSVSVPEDGTVNITLTGFDADGDGLNFSIINSPTRGTLSGSAPNLIYRPNANVTGPDSFSFTASDGRATSSPASININIGSVNDPPTLSPIPPRTVVEGNAVTFAASATDGDVPPDPLTFSLEGAPPGATINPSSGAFSWTPSEAQGPGTYTITVRVTDTGSPPLSATQSFSVTVSEANQPPVFPAIGGQTVNEGSPLAVIAVAADQDQPPQTLNYSLDGAPAGATIDSTSGIFSWTPSEAQGPGRYTINVRVTDSGGASATASFEINVQEVNAPPTLAPIQNQSVRGGQTLSFTVSASDPDVPAQTLTFSLPFGGPSGASINPTTGTFSWTPPAGLPDSTESVTVQVTDSAGLSALQSFSIAVAASNTPPLIAPIAPQSINEGVGLTVNFSATDTDQPTQTLTFALEPGAPTGVNLSSSGVLTWTPTEAQGPGAYPIAVRVTDNGTPPLSAAQVVNVTVNEVNTPPVLAAIADQTVRAGNLLTVSAAATDSDLPPNALTYSLGAGAPAGASVDAGTGSFSWTPTPAQGGTTVPITILVSDNATPPGTASRTFNVAVSPSNTAPTLAPIAPRTIPEGSPFSLTITAADTDVPANTITYTLGGGAPAGLTIDPNTGVLSWTPTEAQGPSVNPVSVVATDNGVPPLTATVQITINVTEVNQPPTIGAIADQTIEAGLVLTVPVAANDPDLPPNTLAFSLGPGTPTGVTINSGTGEVSWRPTGLQGPATHRITVVATDNGTPALSANQSFSVVVTRQNQPPVLAAIPDQTVEEGRELTFTASATDPDAGQTIAYTLAPGAPPGATINQTTGVFTWTPNEAQGPGPFVVTVRATDNGAPSVRSTQDVRITVTEANVAPVLAAIPDQSITSTDTLRLTAKATDADVPANTLTYSLEPGAPAGATIDGVTGVFTFTPPPAQQPGTLRVSVRATDNGTPPLSDAKAFNIVIRAGVNLPPTISQISNQTTAENRPTGAIAFTVNDPDTPVANLRVTATSSNPTLVPTEGIVISGESTNRTVTITPAKDQTGTATITLRVEENTGGSATTSFDFTVSALPTGIAKQPEKQDVVAGGLAAFSVLATGSPPFTYQWRLNGTDIPGATNSVYTVSNVQTNHAGTYSVVVGNRVSSVTSAGAVLSVIELLRITKQPIGQAVLAGGNVTLVATAAGRGTLRYQWRLNGADLPGETNPSLVLLNVDITKAGTYSVRVSDETGAFVDSQGAVLVVNAVSAFTQQPQSQTVVEGTNVTFTVQATGAPPPRLQWQFNGVDIPGETGASLSLQNVRPPNAGQYSVVASNPAGSTNSAAATLTVVTAPAVSRQPQSQTAKAGDAVSFTVSVSGTEPIQYRWRFVAGAAGPASPSRGNSVALLSAGKQAALPGSEIPGATGPTLTVPNVQAGNVGEYFAVVSNLAGTAVSSGAKLDVLAPATITQHPQNQIANAGGTATFSVAATGTAPLIHQWRVNGVDVPGATNATFAMTNIQATDAGAVQVVVANAAGPVVSNPATLTVNQGVTIVTHPASQSATNGASVVFSVVAAGTPPLAYQWRFEGQNLPGQTGSSLTIASVGIVNSGRYTVAVRNVAGEVVSNEANLGVIEPPSIQTQPANQSVNLGATVTFTVVASGDAPLAYQWQKNGVNIPGATGPTLTISNVQPGDQGTYNVVVSNAGGALTSNSATLGVILPVIASGNSAQNAPPPIESAEGSFDGGSNEAAGGAGQIARKNAPPRTGEERWFSWRAPQSGIVTFTTVGSTFDTELAVFTGVAPNLTAVASDDDRGGFFSSEVKFNAVRGTTYLVQVKGFGGAAGKIVVGFKLQQTAQRLPEITSAPPLVQTVTAGQPVTLRVETRAQADPLSYQWFKDDTAIPGATQNQYTILSVRDSDAARYTVRITANPPGQSPVSIESLPAIVQIGTTGSSAVDKFKSAPSLSGGPQLQSLSGDFIKNAGGSVARGYSGSQVFNTFGASKEQGEPNHCDVIGGASQWFVYQGITNGIVHVSTEGSDFDTVLAVYTGPGTDFASLKLEACDNNGGVDGKTSALNLAVKQGTAYYIAVDGVKGATGTVRLSYQFGAGPAISVQPQSQSAPLGGTVAMFVETTNALSTVSTTIPQVGYQWQKDGLPVRGETNRSLALLSVKVADAGDYQVVVSNFAGSSTSAVARVSINVPLSFTLAPQSQTVKIGNAATFIATASGTPPISYQWRFNGLNVTGATNSTYEVPNVQPANAGAYSVVAQNPANTIESPPAFLGINQAPAITVPPVHQVAALNGSATFTVTAIGTPPLSYQWRLGGVDIPGAASATLTINNVSAANVGEYTVVVSNASDSVASPPARLDIRIPLTIVEDPQSQTVTVGGSAIFNVRVAGPTQMAFQWLKDGVAIPGANSANLALANVQPGDAGQYTVAVASGTEFAESKPATLTIGSAPVITRQPVGQIVFAGSTNVSFSVTATGAGPLSYQWFKNSAAIAGATNSTLALAVAQVADTGIYSVTVSNASGSAVSELAVLTVQQIVSDARFDAVTGFQFRLSIPAGKTATVESSADLVNWITVTPVPVTGIVDIQDPQAPAGAFTFYRIIIP
ncbi:MAG: immunoglobulin domain-containing protein [Verrucomicrobia bacterium]|nr:immunoglobulin domain-containing protein [Verrucomicrobiota bacterium]